MLNLMIVDDEPVIRKGIKTSIDWHDYHVAVAGEAANGEEALRKLAEVRVDILLTDIRMPIMDGIELAKRVRDAYPDIEIILLSAYEDFAYAKEAMNIGIKNYLLKPIRAEDLIAIVLETREVQKNKENTDLKNKMLQENLPHLRSMLLADLLKKNFNKQDLIRKARALNIELAGPRHQAAVIDIDDFPLFTKGFSMAEKEAYKFAVLNIAEEILQSHVQGFACYGELDKIVLLVNTGALTDMGDIYEEIQYCVRNYLKLSVTIGIGRMKESLAGIAASYGEAKRAIQQKVFQGKGKIIRADDRSWSETQEPPILTFTEEEKMLIHHLKSLDANKFQKHIDQMFRNFNLQHSDFEEIKSICIRLVLSLAAAVEEMGIDSVRIFGRDFIPHLKMNEFETLADMERWLKDKAQSIMAELEADKSSNLKRIVQAGIQYVESHYGEDITLSDVASRVYVTPSYFSKVFREEMGITFIKWLNQFRIEKAKELLQNSWLKTYEVAERVGYNDYKYFSGIFKKVTGLSPRAYRER